MKEYKINMVKRSHMKKPYYLLDGWYECEYGVQFVHTIGGSLEDCVRQVLREHPEFGDTDLEVDGGYLAADYDVSKAACQMAQWLKQEGY